MTRALSRSLSFSLERANVSEAHTPTLTVGHQLQGRRADLGAPCHFRSQTFILTPTANSSCQSLLSLTTINHISAGDLRRPAGPAVCCCCCCCGVCRSVLGSCRQSLDEAEVEGEKVETRPVVQGRTLSCLSKTPCRKR